MTKAIILNKYRNELGRACRKKYDNGFVPAGVIVHQCVLTNVAQTQNAVLC